MAQQQNDENKNIIILDDDNNQNILSTPNSDNHNQTTTTTTKTTTTTTTPKKYIDDDAKLATNNDSDSNEMTTSHTETPLPDWIALNESVLIRPYNHSGVISFIGPTHFSVGIFASDHFNLSPRLTYSKKVASAQFILKIRKKNCLKMHS